jgi:hypothetical protein
MHMHNTTRMQTKPPTKKKITLGFSHENTDLDNSNSTGKMLVYANARNGKIMKAQEPDS